MGRGSKTQKETLSWYSDLGCPHCVRQNLLFEKKKGVRKKKLTLRTIQLECCDCGIKWSLSWSELRKALFKSAIAQGKKPKEVNKIFSEIVGGFVRTKKKSSKE